MGLGDGGLPPRNAEPSANQSSEHVAVRGTSGRASPAAGDAAANVGLCESGNSGTVKSGWRARRCDGRRWPAAALVQGLSTDVVVTQHATVPLWLGDGAVVVVCECCGWLRLWLGFLLRVFAVGGPLGRVLLHNSTSPAGGRGLTPPTPPPSWTPPPFKGLGKFSPGLHPIKNFLWRPSAQVSLGKTISSASPTTQGLLRGGGVPPTAPPPPHPPPSDPPPTPPPQPPPSDPPPTPHPPSPLQENPAPRVTGGVGSRERLRYSAPEGARVTTSAPAPAPAHAFEGRPVLLRRRRAGRVRRAHEGRELRGLLAQRHDGRVGGRRPHRAPVERVGRYVPRGCGNAGWALRRGSSKGVGRHSAGARRLPCRWRLGWRWNRVRICLAMMFVLVGIGDPYHQLECGGVVE